MLHHGYPLLHQETSLSLGLSAASSVFAFFPVQQAPVAPAGGSWLLAVIVILLHHADLIVSYCITKATIAMNKQDLGFLGYNDGSGLYLFSDNKWCRQCCPHWCSSAYLVRLGLGSRHELCQCTCPGTPVTPEMVLGVRPWSFGEIVNTWTLLNSSQIEEQPLDIAGTTRLNWSV